MISFRFLRTDRSDKAGFESPSMSTAISSIMTRSPHQQLGARRIVGYGRRHPIRDGDCGFHYQCLNVVHSIWLISQLELLKISRCSRRRMSRIRRRSLLCDSSQSLQHQSKHQASGNVAVLQTVEDLSKCFATGRYANDCRQSLWHTSLDK